MTGTIERRTDSGTGVMASPPLISAKLEPTIPGT